MTKPLEVVSAADPVSAIIAYTKVIAGEQAIFIRSKEFLGEKLTDPIPNSVADNVAAIIESSGSTGEPKRIALSLAALMHAARAGQERLGPSGQWLLTLPINFIAGQQVIIRSILSDTQPVIMNPAMPFTTEAFERMAAMLNHSYKYTSLIPIQLAKLVAAAENNSTLLSSLRSFRNILVGGQHAPKELLDSARSLGINVVESYGMTETAGGCIYDGIPLLDVRVKIAPDSRLLIQGKTLAEDMPDWIYTNDLAELEDGKLKILGRSDRVIISGGIKISLDRVEYLAAKVTGVGELAAIGIPSPWGEQVGLVYVGSPEVSDDLANQLVSLLGPAGKPVRIIRVDNIPKLATGKIDYLAIKKIFEESN